MCQTPSFVFFAIIFYFLKIKSLERQKGSEQDIQFFDVVIYYITHS